MPTPLSLINRAYRLATGVGADAHVSPVIDNLWAFEEAFPLALRRAMTETPMSDAEIESYRREHELTLVNGEAVLPDAVLDEFLDSSTLYSDTDTTIAEASSFASRWQTYMRPVHSSLHYYATKEGAFHFREAAGDPFTYDGDIKLVCVSMPDKPANISTNMDLPVDLADRVVEVLAGMIVARPNA